MHLDYVNKLKTFGEGLEACRSRSRPGGGFPFLFSLPLDGTKEAHRAQRAYCLLCFSGLCEIFISELQRMECEMPFVWRQPEAARRKE